MVFELTMVNDLYMFEPLRFYCSFDFTFFTSKVFKIIFQEYQTVFDPVQRAGCFAFIVLRMSCYCKCSEILPHSVVGWSVVCDCGIS